MIRCPLDEYNKALRIVFLCLVLINGAVGMVAYMPFISLLEDADIVMVAKVIAIEQCETTKYAIADPHEILKGEWPTDSLLKLQVFEIPERMRELGSNLYILHIYRASPFLRNGEMVKRRYGEMTASQMKELYLDTERIVYRLIFGEGMVTLAGYPG